MFNLLVLIFSSCLCAPALQATAETQELSHDSGVLRNSISNDTQTQVTDINIAFDLPDITTTIQFESGFVQLEGFKSVNNDKIMDGNMTTQLFWVSIGHPHFIKTENPKNSSEYLLFHSSNRGFTTYVQMMTEEQRVALATAARSKYQVDIDARQVVHMILSKFYCSMVMYDESGRRFLISGTVSDFSDFPLRLDFDILPGKLERILFSKLIEKSESDLQFDCHIESSGGKLIKSNTLSISYEQSQKIGIEEKLFGPAGKNGPSEVYVSRNQMFELAHEMYSTLNIVEDYQLPESQFSESFVNDFVSQLATSQFSQTNIDTVLESMSKYSFDISADLRPDTIKKDFGSILNIEKTGSKSRIVVDKKKFSEVEDRYAGSYSSSVSYLGIFKATIKAAFNMSERDINDVQSLDDQEHELNTLARNEAQWGIEGEKVVPKSLNVARMMRSSMKKSLKFNRIRLQQFNAPFERNVKIYASGSSQLLCQNVPTPKVCPYGFDYMPDIDQCLYLNLEPMTWYNARVACAGLKTGAKLVSIKDSAKQEAVTRYLQHQFTKQESAVCVYPSWPAGIKLSWLAGHSLAATSTCSSSLYKWRPLGATETPFNYTNWYPGWPACEGSLHRPTCSFIFSSSELNYRWIDTHCLRELCSVCEF